MSSWIYCSYLATSNQEIGLKATILSRKKWSKIICRIISLKTGYTHSNGKFHCSFKKKRDSIEAIM